MANLKLMAAMPLNLIEQNTCQLFILGKLRGAGFDWCITDKTMQGNDKGIVVKTTK
jgi:hypothetical protein